MRGNKGSITIEMCFIMPIIVGIVMMLIFLILRGLNEGISLGSSQVIVYQYSNNSSADYASEEWENVETEIVLDKVRVDFQVGDDEISATVTGCGEEYAYSVTNIECVREWNMCTNRLRRWQLYGDVLCE